MNKVTQLSLSENTLFDSPPFHGIHVRLLNFDRDVIYKLSKNSRIRETTISNLLCS